MSNHRYFLGGLYKAETKFFGTNVTPSDLCRELGLQIVESVNQASRYIAFDINPEELHQISLNGIDVSARTLLRFEPNIVWPANYDSRYVNQFARVIDIGKLENGSEDCEYWPQFLQKSQIAVSEMKNRIDRYILINSNKISLIPGELYSLRKKIAMETDSIDLYGPGWSTSRTGNLFNWLRAFKFAILARVFPVMKTFVCFVKKPKRYLGVVDNKPLKMREYKYSIIIENSFDVVTEKIFDSFLSGTFPIYVGPNLDLIGVPANLYIRSTPTLLGLKKSMMEVRDINLENWRVQLQEWLNSDSTRSNWDSQQVFARIISKIDIN